MDLNLMPEEMMTPFQKATNKAGKAGVEAARKATDEEIRAEILRRARFMSTSVPPESED